MENAKKVSEVKWNIELVLSQTR